MKNQTCKFTLEQSNRILEMAMVQIGQRFPYLDYDRQQSLAGDVYVHLIENTDYETCQNPSYVVIGSAVNRTAIKSGIIRDKSQLHRKLEKKDDRTEKENKQLDELRAGRRIRENSLKEMIEVSGYDEKYGVTEDAETLHLKFDNLRRIRKSVAGRPFAEKAVELVLEGYEFSEVAEMLGVSYRTLFHNLDGTGNSPLPVVLNKITETAVEIEIEVIVDEPVVEAYEPEFDNLRRTAVELVLDGYEFSEVAEMLGESYRTLFHNEVEIEVIVDEPVVEAPVPVNAPVVNVPFKFYYEPVKTGKIVSEQAVMDFGFLFTTKQDHYNSLYAGRN